MKAHEAAIMMMIANGLKLTRSICASERATGNINAAVAVLLIKLVMMMVPTKTTASAILGLLPPTAAQSSAILAESLLSVMADSSPRAAPRTAMVFHCTLRQPCSMVRQPVISIAEVASRAELSIVITPKAASATMATVMMVATSA